MPRVIKIEPTHILPALNHRALSSLQVAAYARVSTDQDAQINSFEAQKDYYEKLIGSHPGWTLVGIYADRGISGTSREKRPEMKSPRSKLRGIILTNSDCPYEPRTLQYAFQRITEKCGFEDLHFHCLRHTFATKCIRSGFDIKMVSEILGHASVSFTMNRYVHPSMDEKRLYVCRSLQI